MHAVTALPALLRQHAFTAEPGVHSVQESFKIPVLFPAVHGGTEI